MKSSIPPPDWNHRGVLTDTWHVV